MLASCYGASAADVQLLGSAAGQKTAKLAHPLRLVSTHGGALAQVGGVNIHAEVALDGRDRPRLERLCRYIARPPLSLDRLEQHPDGRVRVRFKRAWKDGTHAVLLEPLDSISRLCALIPPPRFHMLRYHGVFAGHSNDRAEVVPQPDDADDDTTQPQLCLFEPGDDTALKPPSRASRHRWAWLLRRVFAIDVTTCPECQGAMKVITIATDPDDNLPPTRAPPPSPQLELDFAAA